MTIPTMQLRHVWREVNTGDETIRVLVLQQWQEAEGWEHEDIIAQGGFWEDIPISLIEDKLFPT